jgi:hypothetical protein
MVACAAHFAVLSHLLKFPHSSGGFGVKQRVALAVNVNRVAINDRNHIWLGGIKRLAAVAFTSFPFL